MKEALLLKGKHEIIILPEFSDKANKFYHFLENLFKNKGFKIRVIESIPKYSVSKKISGETKYLVGHSRGANKILKEFNPKDFPNIKGVVLFDSLSYLKDNWNKLKLPKLFFGSEWNQDYS